MMLLKRLDTGEYECGFLGWGTLANAFDYDSTSGASDASKRRAFRMKRFHEREGGFKCAVVIRQEPRERTAQGDASDPE